MKLRRMAALLGAVALTFSLTSVVLATGPTGHTITICHANSDEKAPYVTETPDIAQAGYGDTAGHAAHGGDGVWYPGAKGDGFNWGDIIPPYDYTPDGGDLFHFDGLNWTEEGQAIWSNDCVAPEHDPSIHVEKTPSETSLPVGGGSVTYTYVVTNTGNVPLTNVTVSDDKCSPVDYVSGDTDGDSKLDLTESWTFSCTTDLTATTTNTAVAAGYDGEDQVTDDDQATVTVEPNAPDIHVDKSASTDSLPAGGGEVTYTYEVTNTGNVPLSNVSVTDDKCAPVGYVSGDTNTNDELDLTETWTYTCTTTITESTTNTALATGHDGETEVTDTDDKTVTVAPAEKVPGISIDKTASVTTIVAGEDITYSYLVTNTGDIDLDPVTVSDDNGTPGDTSDDFTPDCPATKLAVGEHMTCTAVVSGTQVTTTNIAVATGWYGNEESVTDSDDATVTVGEGGVEAETSVPTAPATDQLNSGATGDAGATLPLLLLILGVIGAGAVVLTPKRGRR